jgi:uncharacterized protein (TIGR02453 family)
MKDNNFQGFTQDAFRFFMEIAFSNNREFYEANKERYRKTVLEPMRALASELLPEALEIDPEFDTRLGSIVSRIRRDTRFSKDKSMYRDHSWLGFRRPGKRISESFTLYFEVTTSGYGYGMGMYSPDPSLMKPMRARMLAEPARFLDMARALEEKGFAAEGELYKRDMFPEAPEELKRYLNLKGIGWHFFTEKLAKSMTPELTAELKGAFAALKPMYRFLCSVS